MGEANQTDCLGTSGLPRGGGKPVGPSLSLGAVHRALSVGFCPSKGHIRHLRVHPPRLVCSWGQGPTRLGLAVAEQLTWRGRKDWLGALSAGALAGAPASSSGPCNQMRGRAGPCVPPVPRRRGRPAGGTGFESTGPPPPCSVITKLVSFSTNTSLGSSGIASFICFLLSFS